MEAGLEVLHKIKTEVGVPVLTDVHEVSQVDRVAEVVDVLQIPAFLCRQTDLILAAVKTGKAVNVKKGQFLAPQDAENIVTKARQAGCEKLLLTERGATFGYNNLVVDMRAFPIMRSFGVPVVFDVTHSLQLPGGLGDATGGQSEYIEFLARAGVACGVDAVFMEVHDCPERALSDGPNALPLDRMQSLLNILRDIHQLVRSKSDELYFVVCDFRSRLITSGPEFNVRQTEVRRTYSSIRVDYEDSFFFNAVSCVRPRFEHNGPNSSCSCIMAGRFI
jgi:2-dehydro-3-deoxyphosphooctonate aldolase (KDO 8-P synthase)